MSLAVTVIVAEAICAEHDKDFQAELLGSTLFMNGVTTLAMVTLGIRYVTMVTLGIMYVTMVTLGIMYVTMVTLGIMYVTMVTGLQRSPWSHWGSGEKEVYGITCVRAMLVFTLVNL
jgi:hypothetical protein